MDSTGENVQGLAHGPTKEGAHTRILLPEKYVYEASWANFSYPQTRATQPLAAGAVIARMALDRQFTWEQFRKAAIDKSYVDNLVRKVNFAHAASGAPEIDSLSVARVLNSIGNDVRVLAEDLADALIPQGGLDKRQKLERLFTDSNLEPLARAATELWEAAAVSLKTNEAKTIGRELVGNLKVHQNKPVLDRYGYKAHFNPILARLYSVTKNGVEMKVSEIKGVTINNPSIDTAAGILLKPNKWYIAIPIRLL